MILTAAIAAATAAGIIFLTLLVSKLVRLAASGTSELAFAVARARDLLSTRPGLAARAAGEGSLLFVREKAAAPEGEEPARHVPEEAPVVSAAETVAPHVPGGRRAAVKQLRRSKMERDPVGAEAAPVKQPDGGAYMQVGEQVAAVLAAAERAAAEITANAEREAEQTRAAAEETAAETLAEAAVRRADADDYSKKRRGSADEDAGRKLAEAEERARAIVAEAEQKANGIVADATRRRAALVEGTEDIETRIESMLTTIRGVTSELEGLMSLRRRTAQGRERSSEERLDTALEPPTQRARAPRSYVDR